MLPADILGQAYEQFLGKVIRLTSGHQAKVEEKPEVKKAGGVYYTPTYIVEYIVKQTVGWLVEGKTPKDVAKLKVLDPACGSGSFLIGAYQFLLDWHRDWYAANQPEKHPKEVHTVKDGWRLNTAKRKEILLNNIFGVDIDAQAVEVTKLSLLLKVLEGENRETIERQKKLFHERALPDLGSNIKCGNSLIGPDFYDGQQRTLFDEEEQYRINAFDWRAEFPSIMKSGGFDAVIGNPPYVRIQRIEHAEADYLFKKYECPTSKIDLSVIFIEQALLLSSKLGLIGLICTSQWLSVGYGAKLRNMLSDGRLHEITDFGSLPVFKNADTYPAIFILSPTARSSLKARKVPSLEFVDSDSLISLPSRSISLDRLKSSQWNLCDFDLLRLLDKRGISWSPITTFGKAYIGAKCGLNQAFVLTRKEAKSRHLEKSLLIPYAYRGSEVQRYQTVLPESVIIYPYFEGTKGESLLISEDQLAIKYPKIYDYLKSFRGSLQTRMDSRKLYATGSQWYRHLRAGSFQHINAEKLTLKGISKRPEIGLLSRGNAFDGARCPSFIFENLFRYRLEFLIGVLNSRTIAYFLRCICPPKLSGYVEFSISALKTVPIRTIDFTTKSDKARHDLMVELVERMLKLHAERSAAKTDQQKTIIERQIATIDNQIDQLVYELYGLNDAEIALVEEATAR